MEGSLSGEEKCYCFIKVMVMASNLWSEQFKLMKLFEDNADYFLHLLYYHHATLSSPVYL
jgi:hypothetical protein